MAYEAHAHGNIDLNCSPVVTTIGSIPSQSPIGHEFIPTVSNLAAVDLLLVDFGAPSQTSTITVNIRAGTIGGPILGSTTQSVTIPGGPSAQDVIHFDFLPNPVPLTPNVIHVIELQSTENFGVARGGIIQDLCPGNTYVSGVLQTSIIDWVYTTYFVEDELVGGKLLPLDTTSLLLAGATSTTWMIPVVLSGIGIGLFVFSKKPENS